MISFIIPLKSETVSKDWNQVCALCERCLNSIINQTSNKFLVTIVCHEKPNFKLEHPSISYIQVDFPPPDLKKDRAVDLMDNDKNNKMWRGLEYVRQFDPTHVMFVDADDCVSCRIAEFVSKNPTVNGWFLDNGYVYEDGSDCIFFKKDKFYCLSGTSHIIKYSLLMDEDISNVYKDSSFALHQHIVTIMRERNTPLFSLPFPGAVYITKNGENIYQGTSASPAFSFFFIKEIILTYPRMLRRIAASRVIEQSISDEFSLNVYPALTGK